MTKVKVSRNSPCFCGSGLKTKNCHSDVHEDSRAGYLIKAYQALEEKKEEKETQIKQYIPCQKGCSNCCWDAFSITEIEFELIMREMKTWSQNEVEAVYDEALNQCQTLSTRYPSEWKRLEEDGTFNQNVFFQSLHDEANRERNPFPCPLLNKHERSCSVYSVRPFVCRSLGVTHMENSPSPVCEFIKTTDSISHITPEISEDYQQFNTINLLTHPKTKEQSMQRAYPIFYWFKIFYNRTGKKIAQYNHYDRKTNFDRPIQQADTETLRSYGIL